MQPKRFFVKTRNGDRVNVSVEWKWNMKRRMKKKKMKKGELSNHDYNNHLIQHKPL